MLSGTGALRVCILLTVIVSNLHFMFKACLLGKLEGGGERKKGGETNSSTLLAIFFCAWQIGACCVVTADLYICVCLRVCSTGRHGEQF